MAFNQSGHYTQFRLTPIRGKQIRNMGSVKINQKDLVVMKELLEAGEVVPVIDRQYPLSEGAEALRYLGAGHAKECPCVA